MTGEEFIAATGDFWISPDGKNHWLYGDLVEERWDHCQACGHEILYNFLIRKDDGSRTAFVGSECIKRVALTFQAVEYARFMVALKRQKKMAARKKVTDMGSRLKGWFTTKARGSVEGGIEILPVPGFEEIVWNYNGKTKKLGQSIWWYAEQMETGAKRFRYFENALKVAMAENGVGDFDWKAKRER